MPWRPGLFRGDRAWSGKRGRGRIPVPRCRVGDEGPSTARPELARPTVAALVVLRGRRRWPGPAHGPANRAPWAGMAGMGHGPSARSSPSPVAWVVMMGGDDVCPLRSRWSSSSRVWPKRRRGWQVATWSARRQRTSGVWLIFGVGVFTRSTPAAGMPWPNQGVGGRTGSGSGPASIPSARSNAASQARCRELCALHGPLPFNLTRSAVVRGARATALSCLGLQRGPHGGHGPSRDVQFCGGR